jgi:peptidoglycan/LPS O-acetylase OafA/YrhL
VLYVFSTAWNWFAAAIHTNTDFHKPPLHLMLPGYLNSFALGMLLAVLSVWYAKRELPGWMRAVDRYPVLPWLVAAAAFVVVSKGIGLNGGPTEHVSTLQYVLRFALYSVVGGAMIAPAVIGDQTQGLVRRLLANRALLFLGIVSYSFFLYHLAVILQLERWHVDRWVAVPLALGGSVAIAVVSYYLIERPFMSLKRLVSTGSDPGTLEAIAEPTPVAAPEVARSG